jgi:uncharacterized membrane-anchored protein YhcB (DUF1043 family)
MLEKDLESKTKLLSSVKSKAMTVILDTKSLITQIQNRKATLERLKDQNQQYMEQYADLAEQMKWDYNQLYGNVNDHTYNMVFLLQIVKILFVYSYIKQQPLL